MAIVVNVDVMLAKRKMSASELAEKCRDYASKFIRFENK